MNLNGGLMIRRDANGAFGTARTKTMNSLIRFAIVASSVALVLGQVGWAQTLTNFETLERELRANITNQHTPDDLLLESISRLGPVAEPASFWTRIADDTNYSLSHRRRAVFALFRRHCDKIGGISDLRRVLMPCAWLKNSRIEKVPFVFGWVPVEVNSGESIFTISVLNGPKIYIRMRGDIDYRRFVSELFGREGEQSANVDMTVLQFGYGDDYEKWLHNKIPADQDRSINLPLLLGRPES